MQWIPFLTYAFAMAFSPGPNTLLALSSGNRFSTRQTLILFAGMYSGFFLVMLLCAVFLSGLKAFLPGAVSFLKWFGAAFIVYLAYQMAKSGNLTEEKSQKYEKGYGFMKGFLLQFLNVKIALYGVTALETYLLGNFSILFSCFLLTLSGFLAAIVWGFAGKSLALLFSTRGVLINRILAIALLGVAVSLLFT
ncbi:MAG: LysE family transporter [Spirochaetia bacterium]|jgi:cysteine/O-acetylserine efflux protein|nr:LysE family transporter [Spirochaetia bacterium]